MRNRTLPWLIVMAVVLSALAVAQPRPAPRKPKPAPTSKAAPSLASIQGGLAETGAAISPNALRRAKTQSTRAEGVTALLRDPRARNALSECAKEKGVPASQLRTRSLSGKSIPPGTPPDASEPDAPAADLPTYDQFDWEAGVHFSPWGGPRYQDGGTEYALGVMAVAGLYSAREILLPQMIEDDVVLLSSGEGKVELVASLPPGADNYIVTVKLVPADGTPVAEWEGVLGRYPTVVMKATSAAGYGRDLEVVPLADGSGYAALVPLASAGLPTGPAWGMQTQDVFLEIRHPATRGTGAGSVLVSGLGKDVFFGGITISRL